MARLNRNETGAILAHGAVAVDTTARLVVNHNSQRVSLSIRNYGSADVFWGYSASVTASTGYPLKPTEEYSFEDYLGPLYVISSSTSDLRFAEID